MDAKTITFILNGITQAALLFVLGSGLTLAFGLMRVINLSHGAFYLLGGYIGYEVWTASSNWYFAWSKSLAFDRLNVQEKFR